jgi:hypothetical protein
MKNRISVNPTVSLSEAKEIVRDVMPQPKGLVNLVSEQVQAEALASMKEGVAKDKFFFTFNLTDQSIGNMCGVSECLGYNEKAFDFARYMGIIHPNQMLPLTILAKKVFEIVNSGDYPLSFGGNKYVIFLVLRHADGRFILTKRALSCWQYVRTPFGKEMVTAYLNEYIVIDSNYDESKIAGLNTSVLDRQGKRLFNWQERLASEAELELEKRNLFTPKELNIIRKVANEPTLTSKDLAAFFGVTRSTFDTHRKSILGKAHYLWGYMAQTTLKNLAKIMREDCII